MMSELRAPTRLALSLVNVMWATWEVEVSATAVSSSTCGKCLTWLACVVRSASMKQPSIFCPKASEL